MERPEDLCPEPTGAAGVVALLTLRKVCPFLFPHSRRLPVSCFLLYSFAASLRGLFP